MQHLVECLASLALIDALIRKWIDKIYMFDRINIFFAR